MKKVDKQSCGFNVPVRIYESVAEVDSEGGENSALNQCNQELWFRGAAAQARRLIAKKVEELTGVARPKKPVLDEEGKPVVRDGKEIVEPAQTEEKYINYALAESGRKVADLADAIYAAVDEAGLRVDIRKRVPAAPKTKKLAQRDLDAAQKLLDNQQKLTKFVGHYQEVFGDEPETSLEGLARALRHFRDHLEQQFV